MTIIKSVALQKGGRIYTLKPFRDLDPLTGRLRKSGHKWIGYCDGEPCGRFKTRAEFEQFVGREPDLTPRGPHADATERAATWSTYDGSVLLQRLTDNAARRRGGRP
jgi:hypothetical protein